MFVKAMMGKRIVVYTDDDVAKRYSIETTITWEQQEATIDGTAGNFNRTFDNSAFRTNGKRNERKQQTHGCGGQRPSVSSNDQYAAHDGAH